MNQTSCISVFWLHLMYLQAKIKEDVAWRRP